MDQGTGDRLMDVSVIIPCYNKKEYIIDCIQSILDNETSSNVEIIIVDDCSTDNSFLIVQDFLKTKPLEETKNIIHESLPNNKGRSFARNYGANISKGDCLVFLDGDDLIPPNYISECHNMITKENVDICYNDSFMFGSQCKRIEWPDFNIEQLRRGPFIHCSAMHRRVVFEKVCGFDEEMKHGWEDYDYWLSSAKLGFEFKKTSNTWLAYRQYNDNQTSIDDTNSIENQRKIRKHLKKKHGDFFVDVLQGEV